MPETIIYRFADFVVVKTVNQKTIDYAVIVDYNNCIAVCVHHFFCYQLFQPELNLQKAAIGAGDLKNQRPLLHTIQPLQRLS
jgi:hypothetical protein